MAEADDALSPAERLLQRAAEADGDVFRRVVRVDLEVALSADSYVNQAVSRDLLQKVVEHADAGRDGGLSAAVQVHFDADPRLLGLALFLTVATVSHRPFTLLSRSALR